MWPACELQADPLRLVSHSRATDRERYGLAMLLLHRDMEQLLSAFAPRAPAAFPVAAHRSSLLITLARLYAPAEDESRDE